VDEKKLRSLHRDCTLKLRRFIDEAGKMCDPARENGRIPLVTGASSLCRHRWKKEEIALAAFQAITA
jgi:hypothetical protein